MSQRSLDFGTFKCIVKNAPLVSIDLIVRRSDRVLVGRMYTLIQRIIFTIRLVDLSQHSTHKI
ncbi:hypothetical protein DBT_1957 [Dissulfuribacter thermophilus]|uniref:Uncharacterized protein n=1 Tax=Dissulfuribacter thermophilus TaxID=1156395 RepID=A0A1B9F3Z3_9BACT|nr:hypothetical protein DBT_1957 [Dissulfuribacter thermophilus]